MLQHFVPPLGDSTDAPSPAPASPVIPPITFFYLCAFKPFAGDVSAWHCSSYLFGRVFPSTCPLCSNFCDVALHLQCSWLPFSLHDPPFNSFFSFSPVVLQRFFNRVAVFLCYIAFGACVTVFHGVVLTNLFLLLLFLHFCLIHFVFG